MISSKTNEGKKFMTSVEGMSSLFCGKDNGLCIHLLHDIRRGKTGMMEVFFSLNKPWHFIYLFIYFETGPS
jgi:hypothetical protein